MREGVDQGRSPIAKEDSLRRVQIGWSYFVHRAGLCIVEASRHLQAGRTAQGQAKGNYSLARL